MRLGGTDDVDRTDQRLLVSDVDGTLLKQGESTAGLETLGLLLDAQRETTFLVYATGRSWRSTKELIEAGVLPEPDAVAARVGTEVWLPPWAEPDARFRAGVQVGWDRAAVLEAAAHFPAIERQPDRFQSPVKASFFLTRPALLPAFQAALDEHGVQARVIYSANRFLDVLPARAGKRAAVEYLRRRWAIPRDSVLVCGDSGNDLDMLGDERFQSVAVGNSKAELRQLSGEEAFHQSTLPFAAGVLEGAEAFDFWDADGPEER